MHDKNKQIASKEAKWQQEIKTKQQYKDALIQHPAAAPMGTDQEAGGAISTLDGERKYD